MNILARPTLLLAALGLSGAALAHPEYRVTVMAPANSYAADINKDGVVVGQFAYSASATHAFLNRGRGLVDLGTLGGRASSAVALNDKGQVLGHWTSAAGQQRGFIYYAGSRRDIGVLPGRATTFSDINNAGYITAYGAIIDSFEGPHGFLRAPDGSYRDIGALTTDNPMTLPYAINNRNWIAGASGPLTFPDQPLLAFGWVRGTMRELGNLGWSPNAATALNDCGQYTGYASLYEGFRDRVAVIFANGRVIDIDGRPATEDRSSEGTGINGHGHVVGGSDHLSGFVYRGRRMQSLNALIDPALGWNIADPRAINDAGQIAATAYRNGVPYAVRLDLIRPHLLQAPVLATDD